MKSPSLSFSIKIYGLCNSNFSDKTMRKKSGTLFTFQLALVDTLMLIFLPFHLHEKQAFKWVFGSFLCQLTSSGEFSTWSDRLELLTNRRRHFHLLYLVVFFNISVVILTLVAMAFDRYCTVVPNIMTKTVNKHRNKRWFIFSVSHFILQNSFSQDSSNSETLKNHHHVDLNEILNFSDDRPDMDFGNNISVSGIHPSWKWQYHQ